MKTTQKILLIICLIIASRTGIAQPVSLQLDSSLKVASQQNPALMSAYNQYLAALEKVPQVGGLPDPQASLGFFLQPMELLGGNQLANIGLMQMLPWFGSLSAAKDEASLMAKARYNVFYAMKADLDFQVKSNWYNLMKTDLEIKLVEENIRWLISLEKLTLTKFQAPSENNGNMPGKDLNNAPMNSGMPSAGKTNAGMPGMNGTGPGTGSTLSGSSAGSGMSLVMSTPSPGLQNVLRVKMELLEQQDRLALLIDERKTSEAAFNLLLNRSSDLPVVITDSLMKVPFEVNAVSDSIMANSPMLSMLENERQSYAMMEQKARKMGLPMLGVGLNYMLIQKREGNLSMMNGNDMFMPMLSVSIPVYRNKNQAMVKEARLMQLSSSYQLDDTRNQLLLSYRQMIENLNDAERRIALYKEQEALARKTTELLLSGFTTNGNGYEEVLRMQLKVLEYGFKHVEAISDYNTSVALGEKLMGMVSW
ncbi:MAG: TolC family protein [Bacteroidales bacterium]|nr:TolC family protein [Bacteroidales bacterium]